MVVSGTWGQGSQKGASTHTQWRSNLDHLVTVVVIQPCGRDGAPDGLRGQKPCQSINARMEGTGGCARQLEGGSVNVWCNTEVPDA